MEKDRLIERLNFIMGKKDTLALAEVFTSMDDGVSTLFDLCQSDNEMLSFHAAWVLENVLSANPELFGQSISKIIDIIPTITSPSLKRHFCKLLNLALNGCENSELPKEACEQLKRMDLEPVIESCFEWLISSSTKPAVKAHCMDILLYLSRRYDWIAIELPYVIEVQLLDATPGIYNKGKKVLEILRKRN
jgi:hypothetical protein